MTAISAPDLVLLRDKNAPQKTNQRLYGWGWPVMWAGTLNLATVGRGTQSLVYAFGGMTAGFSFADMGAGLLVAVGNLSANPELANWRRLLSISGNAGSGTMILDWYDDYIPTNGSLLSIIHYYPPLPKYSWFTVAGPDFRKDGPPAGLGGAGIDYAAQNETPPPLVIMGPDYANELPTSGSLAIALDASNSVAVAPGATIASYAWTVAPSTGAALSSASVADPTLTITTTGKRVVSCAVTDSLGGVSTGRRHYMIGGGVTEFRRGDITVRYGEPDVSCLISSTSPDTAHATAIRPNVDWAGFDEGTLVMIAADDYYGATQKTITSRAAFPDHQRMVFVGYIQAENSDILSNGTGKVELTAVSAVPMFLYSLSLTGNGNPADWYEMLPSLMTIAGNLYHLFKWHSTLLEIADFWLPWTDTVKRSANEEFTGGNLIERARAFCRGRLMGMTGTADGVIVVQRDINTIALADRNALTTTMTLTSADAAGQVRVRLRRRGDTIRVLVSGGSSAGAMNSYQPHLAASARVARMAGQPTIITLDRLMLSDQVEARLIAQRGERTADYKYQEVDFDASGNWSKVFDPAFQSWINLGTIFSGNLRAETDLNSKKCVVRSVSISAPSTGGTITISVMADIEAPEGVDGVDLPIPETPSDDISDGDYDPPEPAPWPPIAETETEPGFAVLVDTTDGIHWTTDTGAAWEERNSGFDPADGADLIYDPWWKTIQGNSTSNPELVILWWTGLGFIRRSADAGATWEDVTYRLGDPPNTHGDSPAPTLADIRFIQVHGSINHFGQFWTAGHWETGGGDERGYLVKTTDNGYSWTWVSV
jgi:hypothetical protein